MDTLIERYQLIYQKDPESKVFAPLAEAYRKMGLVKEAIDLAQKGIQKHPHFASGHVALGRALMQNKEYIKAVDHLKLACDLSPENILAHQSLGDCYAQLKQKNNALNAYKMVLFLNPQDQKIAQIVSSLEKEVYSDSSSEDEEIFSMQKLKPLEKESENFEVLNIEKPNNDTNIMDLERELLLLESRINRGQWELAKKQMETLFRQHPTNPVVLKKRQELSKIESGDLFLNKEWISPIEVKMTQAHGDKLKKLNKLLQNVQSRRKS